MGEGGGELQFNTVSRTCTVPHQQPLAEAMLSRTLDAMLVWACALSTVVQAPIHVVCPSVPFSICYGCFPAISHAAHVHMWHTSTKCDFGESAALLPSVAQSTVFLTALALPLHYYRAAAPFVRVYCATTNTGGWLILLDRLQQQLAFEL